MKVFVTQQVFEDSGMVLFGRGVSFDDGLPFTQADISTINLQIFAADDPGTIINGTGGTNVTVADVVFSSLQTNDPRWTADETGYNFRFTVTPAMLPAGGKTYRFEFKFTPANGEVFHGVFEVPTLGLFRS